MKASPTSLSAIVLSLVACFIAVWKTRRAEVDPLIQEALTKREKQIIDHLAPKIVKMTRDLGTYQQLKPKSNPATIEELLSPLFEMTATIDK